MHRRRFCNRSFDDLPMTPVVNPRLSTVHAPAQEMEKRPQVPWMWSLNTPMSGWPPPFEAWLHVLFQIGVEVKWNVLSRASP
jgi:hypothetical protein